MRNRALLRSVVGAVIAAVCRAMPLLAVVLGALGLAAWLPLLPHATSRTAAYGDL
jgi:hypothetical protein